MSLDYKVGDVIRYRCGASEIRTVRVTNRFEDEGQVGFDGLLLASTRSTMPRGRLVWGWDRQVLERLTN